MSKLTFENINLKFEQPKRQKKSRIITQYRV